MGISSPSRRCPALRAIAVNDAYAHDDVLSTSGPNATALQVPPRCTETVSGYECKRPTSVLNGLATTLTSAHSYSLIRPTPYNASRDRWGSCSFQYALLRYRLGSTSTNISYALLRSHDTVSAAAQQPLPVFHVKPRESQRLSVSDLLTSETLLG